MGTYDEPIGALLVGSWLSSLLEVLIIKGTIEYFDNYPKDPSWKKVFIGVTVVVDFVSLIAAYATVYLVTVTHWGDTVALTNQFWSIPTVVLSTGIVAFLVQGFLIHRIWMLAKNWPFAILLALNALAALACVTASAFIIIKYPRYDQRHRGIIPITLWLSTTTTVDIGITAVLIFWFSRMKTSFKHTENILQRLIRVSLQTGSTTCAVAIAALITVIINPASNIEGCLTFVLGRVYVLTLLYNVNIRSSPNHERDLSLHSSERYAPNLNPALILNEIQVHHTAHVHRDEDSPDVQKTVGFNNRNKTEIDGYSDRGSVSKAR
ncbi:hypothetical protein L218DRAFT_1005190 [Marasmius fiardii PR-910]|nr:hypothetical protein L218DRAFT_1005190 [Marasmius fiardii PR-910]